MACLQATKRRLVESIKNSTRISIIHFIINVLLFLKGKLACFRILAIIVIYVRLSFVIQLILGLLANSVIWAFNRSSNFYFQVKFFTNSA